MDCLNDETVDPFGQTVQDHVALVKATALAALEDNKMLL